MKPNTLKLNMLSSEMLSNKKLKHIEHTVITNAFKNLKGCFLAYKEEKMLTT